MGKKIKEYQAGDHFSSLVLITNANKCVSDKGKNYFNLELRDESGTISAKKWDLTLEDEKLLVIGNILDVYVNNKQTDFVKLCVYVSVNLFQEFFTVLVNFFNCKCCNSKT